MEIDCYYRTSRCVRSNWGVDNLAGCHVLCSTQVTADVSQSDDLEGNARQQRPASTDEVDHEEREAQCTDELDYSVDTSCQELGLVARDTQVAEDSW